ncbi:ABC transporter ATP-binding protein [Roseimaritima ulvae]|uniref:ABC-type transporter ATP-binding protein EcsA n=1 Tax=Roseimaritima ulvae TaxID=980254 RepID=A0A5B9QRS1_9BACT|nr:ABC transporter ATP-binding protein [Roseimaritima ulvae]QEG39756.1 ABC-type transporter ATP-binding protein EcsA [Roseimaritima ulvae]
MIVVDQLQKIYGDTLAVDRLSFSLQSGQICGLVGKNGAGKTTTMRALAGLIDATEGRLQVAGCDLHQDPLQVRRQLAYVPDDPPLFNDLSVGQHLDLIGGIYQVPDYWPRGQELLREFELEDKQAVAARALSRGMRQKLAVVCAYLYEPSVILLDEPLTGLDPPGIRTLLESIRQRAAAGATVIISSHLLAMIENVCTHLLVMQHGRKQFFGPTDQLRGETDSAASWEQAFFADQHVESFAGGSV